MQCFVDKVGTYKTRDGRTVEVGDLRPYSRSSFPISGHILRYTPTGRLKRDWNIWKTNGRYQGYGDHALDLVEKV